MAEGGGAVLSRRPATDDGAYARCMHAEQTAAWKRVLGLQRPYATLVRRLCRGRTLDVGCGVGRCLVALDGRGLGVDRNPACVEMARRRGLKAWTPEDFEHSEWARGERFDSLLMAHVVEHMTFAESVALVEAYLPRLRPRGRIVVVVPQAAGFALDPTHVHPFDSAELEALLSAAGARRVRIRSFPLPSWAGRVFPYNEFVAVAWKAGR